MEPLVVRADLSRPSSTAACMDCLVALPVAIERMRASEDDEVIPDAMIRGAFAGFEAFDRSGQDDFLLVAAAAQDLLYRHIAALLVLDRFTQAYFSLVVRYFFAQLSGRGVRTFYILDNALRDDRLALLLELFDRAGISTVTPRRDGTDWESLSAQIKVRLAEVGHVAYIEPDGAVNHLDAAKELARTSGYVATFRNEAPEVPSFEILSTASK